MKKFPTFILVSFWVTLTSSPLLAKKYGLVVGGYTQDSSASHHDMARITAAVSLGLQNEGHEVVTLFGERQPRGASAFKADYEYLTSKKLYGPASFATKWLKTDSAATASNLEAYFRQLAKTIAVDDTVDIYLAVHGSQDCSGFASSEYPSDVDTWCGFVFGLYDWIGRLATYSGNRIAAHVKSLESSGAKVNLIFHTCHSGRSKQAFAALRNACVFYGSTGISTGNICIESDFSDGTGVDSETSLLEMMGLHYYYKILPQLSADPYFSESKCFQAVRKHYAANQHAIDLKTIADTYWTARPFDKTIHEPSLSTMGSYQYFNRDNFSKTLRDATRSAKHLKTLSQPAWEQWHTGLEELVQDGKPTSSQVGIIESHKTTLETALDRYNRAAEASQNRAANQELDHATIQKTAKEVATAERRLLNLIRTFAGGKFTQETTACHR